MTSANASAASEPRAVEVLIRTVVGRLNAVPYWILALPLRLAIATVFWNSGTAKLANWDTTLALFADEYRLPLLPPAIAAYLAATMTWLASTLRSQRAETTS